MCLAEEQEIHRRMLENVRGRAENTGKGIIYTEKYTSTYTDAFGMSSYNLAKSYVVWYA